MQSHQIVWSWDRSSDLYVGRSFWQLWWMRGREQGQADKKRQLFRRSSGYPYSREMLVILLRVMMRELERDRQIQEMLKGSNQHDPVKDFFIFQSWSIVYLQCCVNYCCRAKWLDYIHTHILFHILFHSGLSQHIPSVIHGFNPWIRKIPLRKAR